MHSESQWLIKTPLNCLGIETRQYVYIVSFLGECEPVSADYFKVEPGQQTTQKQNMEVTKQLQQ